MSTTKYKFDNRLWQLEKDTGMFIDSINGRAVVSLCFLCHNVIYKGQKGYISFETERSKVIDEDGKEKITSKFIHVCSDCAEH